LGFTVDGEAGKDFLRTLAFIATWAKSAFAETFSSRAEPPSKRKVRNI
jgi:hypothetical protein